VPRVTVPAVRHADSFARCAALEPRRSALSRTRGSPVTRLENAQKRNRVELFYMSGGRIHAGAAILAATLVVTAGCGRRVSARLPPPPPVPSQIGATETGIASWYGAPYHGRPAASGEIYDMEQLTAAHRTLPFGALVEVSDLDNGKRVDVRINDRGPFVDGRIIDLSRAAAREIGMLGPGTARVRLTVLATPALNGQLVPPLEEYVVQAGAFSDRQRAESSRTSLETRFEDVRIVETPPLWRVLVGRRLTLDAATKLAARVRSVSGEAVVVRDR